MIYLLCLFVLQLTSDPIVVKMSDKPTKSGTFSLKKILKLESKEGFYSSTKANMSPNGNNYFVLDRGNKVIVVFDKNGEELYSFGKEGNGPGEFNKPRNIYVTNDQILITELMKGHLFDIKGNFIKQVSLILGGKVPFIQVLNNEFYFVQFDNKNPKYFLSKLKQSGEIEYLIKNSSYKKPKSKSYSVSWQRKTFITETDIYKANEGVYKIFQSDRKTPLDISRVITRNFDRIKETSFTTIKDPKTNKFIKKEKIIEASDITSIEGVLNNHLFVQVKVDYKEGFALIDIIKDGVFIDQVKLTAEQQYFSFNVIEDKIFVNDSNDESGPFVTVYKIIEHK